jgi:hypothetical protein
MKKTYLLGGGIAVLTAAILAGCNSNDDNGTAAVAPAATQSVTITPSLGKILNAKVVARNATTGAVLGDGGNTGNSGIATFNIPTTTAPVVFEVQGAAGVKYFDESKMAEVDFGAGQTLKVVIPTVAANANIGVSALTDIAYKTALKNAGGTETVMKISADTATKANAAILKALAPELASITITPTLVGSAADLDALTNTPEGKYALRLAALAKLSAGSATPALDILAQLNADFADGTFDGMANGTAVTAYTQANLQSKIQTNLNSTITAANLSGFNVNAFTLGFGNIVINTNTGTGTQTGNTCLLDVSGTASTPVGVVPFAYKYCYMNMPVNACSSSNSQLNSLASAAANQQGTGVTVNIGAFTPSTNCKGATVSYDYATGAVLVGGGGISSPTTTCDPEKFLCS